MATRFGITATTLTNTATTNTNTTTTDTTGSSSNSPIYNNNNNNNDNNNSTSNDREERRLKSQDKLMYDTMFTTLTTLQALSDPHIPSFSTDQITDHRAVCHCCLLITSSMHSYASDILSTHIKDPF